MIKLSELIEEIDPVSAELGQGLGEAGEESNQKPGSKAAQQAKAKGLDYMKFGRWGKDGQVTHKSDQSGNLVPLAAAKAKAPSSGIKSRSPEGSRSKTPLAQAPKGDYGNPEMPTSMPKPNKTPDWLRQRVGNKDAEKYSKYYTADEPDGRNDGVAQHNINRGKPADHDFSNEPEHQSDLDNWDSNNSTLANWDKNISPFTGQSKIRNGGYHADRGEALAGQTEKIVNTKYNGNRELARKDIKSKLHKALQDPIIQKWHPNGSSPNNHGTNPTNMTGGFHTGPERAFNKAGHQAGVAERSKYLRSVHRVEGLAKMLDSLDYLDAIANRQGDVENPEYTPRDASGAGHFGPDQ